MVVVGFDTSSSLNLGRGSCSCRPGGLSGSRRGEVWLLLAGVEHHRRSSCRGGVLLDRVHGCSRAWVLQVVLARMVVMVVVVHVGRREVLELLVVVGSHRRGAARVSSHHFWNIGGSGATQSHPPPEETMRDSRHLTRTEPQPL